MPSLVGRLPVLVEGSCAREYTFFSIACHGLQNCGTVGTFSRDRPPLDHISDFVLNRPRGGGWCCVDLLEFLCVRHLVVREMAPSRWWWRRARLAVAVAVAAASPAAAQSPGAYFCAAQSSTAQPGDAASAVASASPPLQCAWGLVTPAPPVSTAKTATCSWQGPAPVSQGSPPFYAGSFPPSA